MSRFTDLFQAPEPAPAVEPALVSEPVSEPVVETVPVSKKSLSEKKFIMN